MAVSFNVGHLSAEMAEMKNQQTNHAQWRILTLVTAPPVPPPSVNILGGAKNEEIFWL